MFNFLKKLFQKQETAQKETIKLSSLESWFNERIKSFFNNLNINLDNFIERANNESKKTKENINKLRNAKLQNPKIPVREKQFMEGNREAYIKRAEAFLRNLSLEKKDYTKLKNLSSNFTKEIEGFGKSTMKAYQVLQHFFANESRTIAINIKNFESIFKEIKEFLDKNNVEDIDKIKNNINNLKKSIANKENLKEELDKKSSLIKKLENKKMAVEKEIKELKESNEFKELKGLLEDKESINNKITNYKNNLTQLFSVLEHSLKKYVRMVLEDEKLLKKYLENPFNTLLEDKEFKILKILNGLEKNIENNNIELKDKKKSKTVEAINKLNEEFFKEFISKYNQLNNELNNTNKKIDENKVKDKEEELDTKLKNINENIEKTNNEINNLKIEIEKIDINQLKNNLENEIRDKLRIELIIS